ncbi:MAG: hypothetical protein EA409_03785 [Saprospirales bacterium]|nr:MAG: hypothetical protein EA409_03785 [Saprospirales bacterium]
MCINDLYSFSLLINQTMTGLNCYLSLLLIFVLVLRQTQHKCFCRFSTSSKSKKIKAVKYLAVGFWRLAVWAHGKKMNIRQGRGY